MKIIQTNLQYAKPLIPLNLNMVKYIILHHPDITTATVEEIHQWHLENGWSGFGYNEYIRKDGTVYIGRADCIGAQCLNYNSVSYGICLEGNYDVEKEMPDAQFQSLLERIKYHQKRFPFQTSIEVHSKFVDTTCAGTYFPINKLIGDVNKMNTITEKQVQPIDKEFEDNLEILKSFNKINTPQYWLDHCVEGGKIDGLYAKKILNEFADFIKSIPVS